MGDATHNLSLGSGNLNLGLSNLFPFNNIKSLNISLSLSLSLSS